jgi:hypothetical protein
VTRRAARSRRRWSAAATCNTTAGTRTVYDKEKIGEYEPTIADVHTAPTDAGGNERGWVLHAATGRPMLMVFTVPDCSGI